MKISILTGAGISAESGIKTFRDADGLWEGHDVMEVASPHGWVKNQELVLDFYNQRRKQLKSVVPNEAHLSISRLQKVHKCTVITQNVDNLHEKAGNEHVLHLHGELTKVRSIANDKLIYSWEDDLKTGDLCEDGHQLRPHIVWFGEAVPTLNQAIIQVQKSDLCIVVGTSMQVYPAASLVAYLPAHSPIYYIDPRPQLNYELNQMSDRLKVIEQPATIGLPMIIDQILTENKI